MKFANFKRELWPLLQLAGPLALADLGWMSMGVVDTMMVGRLPAGAEAIGAVSLGSILIATVGLSGGGLLLGLDTLVSQAFGAGKLEDCHRSLLNSLYLSLVLAPLLMGFVWLCVPLLRSFDIHPGVLRQAIPYLHALNWSTLPLLFYFCFRRYLQAMNLVKPVTFALVTANLVNLVGNWMLVYGHLGAPALGAEGSGWATCISRIYMSLLLLGYVLYHDARHGTGLAQTPLQPDLLRIGRLVGLGFPVATQLTLEIGVFATATVLIGRLDPGSLAAHQIAMMVVSVTYMVPLGVSSAAAVRVGQALGRRDLGAASLAGWTALALGAGFMFCSALSLLLFPGYIVRIFTADMAVMRIGVSLLFVAAFFQLCDGLQTVATGALRGAGDTRTAMISHLVGYWMLGLPLGYVLCFPIGWGATGLWVGLCVALILIGLVLLLAWHRKVRALAVSPAYAGSLFPTSP